jgi:hypothetical protein
VRGAHVLERVAVAAGVVEPVVGLLGLDGGGVGSLCGLELRAVLLTAWAYALAAASWRRRSTRSRRQWPRGAAARGRQRALPRGALALQGLADGLLAARGSDRGSVLLLRGAESGLALAHGKLALLLLEGGGGFGGLAAALDGAEVGEGGGFLVLQVGD